MANASSQIRHLVGVMTGTSIDGIDAALVHIDGHGLQIKARLVQHLSKSLGDIGPRMRRAAEQQLMTAGESAQLAWDFGMSHAEIIGILAGEHAIDLICIHGQTVFHQPPISWQLVNPAPIAARFGCAVVSDLRQADLAAGGQGAPITPIADWILFRDEKKRRAIVNLGGFCNLTILPASPSGTSSPVAAPPLLNLTDIGGCDVCACNQILDAIARQAMNVPFDEHGSAAMRGRTQPQAVETLRAILDRQSRGGRSLGTGDETLQWVDDQIRSGMSGDDLAASAVDAISRCIAASVCVHHVDELVLAGGGARNLALRTALAALAAHAGMNVLLSDELGVPIDAREAMAFAVLGALCADGVPITLPQVTGCSTPAPVAGVWTFGGSSQPSRMLPPHR